MARRSIRNLFTSVLTSKTTPTTKTRRPATRWNTIEQLEDRTVPAFLYVGELSDYSITVDADSNGVPTSGDTVVWNQDGLQHDGQVAVTGLNFGTQAFTSIQQAINSAQASGDTIYVTAGIYSENVIVDRSVTILGAKNATAPTSIAPRGSISLSLGQRESVIQPTTNNPTDGTVVSIQSNGVTFDGFRVTGSSFSLTGGTPVNGIPVYAARGIATGTNSGGYVAVDNFKLEDTVVLNTASQGVYLAGPGTTDTTGNLVNRNVIDNTVETGMRFKGIDAAVTSNLVTRTPIGIRASDTAGATLLTVTGNNVTTTPGANSVGISLTDAQGGSVIGGDGQLSNNVTQSASGNGVGLLLQYAENDGVVTFNKNVVSNYKVGVLVYNNDKLGQPTHQLNNLELTGTNTVGSVGVLVTARGNTPYPADGDSGAVKAKLTGTSVTGFETGIKVQESTTSNAADRTAELEIGLGNTVSGGVNGLVIDGVYATLTGATLNTISFSGQSGQFVQLANAAYQGGVINGTTANYDGLTDKFAIENKLVHRPDNATLGLISVVAGQLFVTPGQPGGIQAAINASVIGNTVNVGPGTYSEVLTIPTQITLKGAGASTVNVRPNTTGVTSLVTVTANNVVIDGFTFDGDDGVAANGETVVIGGTVSDTQRGIYVNNGTNGNTAELTATIRNNVIRNFTTFGVLSGQASGSSGKTGGTVTQNAFENIGVTGAAGGFALYASNGNPSFTGNVVTAARVGAWYQFPLGVTGGISVTGNAITTTEIGIAVNNAANAVGPISVANNTVTFANDASPASNVGLLLVGTKNTDGTTATSNTFTYSGSEQSSAYGVLLFNNSGFPTASVATVSGGTITGFGAGAVVVNSLPSDTGIGGTAVGPATLTLSGVTVNVPTGGTGVAAQGGTGGGLASVALTGGTSITSAIASANTTGLLLQGPQARATLTDVVFNSATTAATDTDNATDVFVGTGTAVGAVTFNLNNSFAGNSYYVYNQSANPITLATTLTPQNYDATNNFRIEDRLYHKVDDTAKGLITFDGNNVYVTAPGTLSGTTTDTDSIIQHGIDATASKTGFTVNVEAGSYAQAVNVNQSVTLLGANEGISVGKVPGGVRGSESVIASPSGGVVSLVTVTANNVVIDGFTLDGDDGNAADGVTVIGGGKSDAQRGVYVDNGTNGSATTLTATVRNSFVRNFTKYGVLYGLETAVGGKTDGSVAGNSFDGVGVAGNGSGFALFAGNGNPSFTNNVVTDARVGAWYQIPLNVSGGIAVTGNAITATEIGVAVNQTGADIGAIAVATNDVTITGSGLSVGLLLVGTDNAAGTTATGNDFLYTGGNSAAAYGVLLFNLGGSTAVNPTVSGGTIKGFGVGAAATNDIPAGTPGGLAGTASQAATLTLDGVAITIPTGGTGAAAQGVAAGGGTATIALAATTTPTRLTPASAATGTAGLALQGPQAKVTLGTAAFDGSLAKYIVLSDSAYNGTANSGTPVLDAGNANFGGSTPITLDPNVPTELATLYAIEVKITDQLDDAALGFVQLQTNKAFVTAGGPTGAIQRGVSAEGIRANGTVYVQDGNHAGAVTVNVTGLKLLGANEGISVGKVPGGVRGSESVIASPSGGVVSLVTVTANNVVIDGFTLDGDDGNAADGVTVIGGGKSDAQRGVYVDNGTNGSATTLTATVRNSFVRNFTKYGVLYGLETAVGGKTDGSVAGNSFDGVGVAGNGSGFALFAGNGNPSFTNNVVTDARVGAWYQIPLNVSGGIAVTGNAITATEIGVAVNQTGADIGAIAVATNDVTITGSGLSVGLLLVGTDNAAGTTATGNDFLYTGGNSAAAYGVLLFNLGGSTAVNPTVSGGTIKGFGVGAAATNDIPASTPGGLAGTANQAATLTLDGVEITTTAAGTGVAAQGVTNGGLASVAFAGTTTIAGTGTGLVLDGPLAKVAGNTFATGGVAFAATLTNYIKLASGAYNGTFDNNLDAGNATFGTVLGSTATTAQAFAIVDKITDQVDDENQGFVQLKPNTVYITPTSTSGGMMGSMIQNAVNALRGSNGTVFIKGGSYSGDVSTTANMHGNVTLAPDGENLGDVVTVTIDGMLSLDSGDIVATDLSMIGNDKITTTGNATLGNATLAVNLVNGYTPAFGDQFPTVVATGGGSVSGTFSNTQPFVAGGTTFYTVYSPTAATLTAAGPANAPAPAAVYVDDADAYAGPNGTVVDIDPAAVGVQPGVIGVNAFDTVTEGIAAVAIGGVVNVADGSYVTESVNINRSNVRIKATSGTLAFGSLAGEFSSSVDVNGSTLTVGANDSTTEFAGNVLSGGGNFVKVGTGTLTLSNSNAFGGNTTVNNGTLNLTGSIGGGVFTVNSNGTLTGTGTVNGPVTNNGVVAPGTDGTIGTLNLAGGYTQSATGTLKIDITDVATDNLNVTGTVTLMPGSNLVITPTVTTQTPFKQFQFITNNAADAVSGTFTGKAQGAAFELTVGGQKYLVDYAGGDTTNTTGPGNDVVLVAVPSDIGNLAAVVVDDDYAFVPLGTPVTDDAGAPRTVGYNAFGSIQTGINNLRIDGTLPTPTLLISGGTYTETVSVNRKVAITLQSDGKNPDATGTPKTPVNTVTVNSISDLSGNASLALNRLTLAIGGGTLAGPITGTGTSNLVKVGGGELRLSGTNTYAGFTKIEGGTLKAGADEVIPDFSAVTITSGTLDLTNFGETIGSLAGDAAGNVTLVNASLTAGRSSTNTTFAGKISGTGGVFVKVGAGTLTFTGANIYTGGTLIEAGVLQLSGANGSVTGDIDTVSGFLALNKPNDIDLITMKSTDRFTFTQKVTGGGGVIQNGVGGLELTGVNTYTGGTVVNNGTLKISSDSKLGTLNDVVGNVTVNSPGTAVVTASTGSNRAFFLNGGATLTVASGQTLTLGTGSQVNGGAISGPGSVEAQADAAFVGVNFAANLTLRVTGTSVTMTNVTNAGQLTIATGKMATMTTFTNASNGRITVNGTANVSSFASIGFLEVMSGGLFANVGTADLVFGGGSLTYLGTTDSKADGGIIDLGTADMRVTSGIVRNNGTIRASSLRRMYLDNNSLLYRGNGQLFLVLPSTSNNSFVRPGFTG